MSQKTGSQPASKDADGSKTATGGTVTEKGEIRREDVKSLKDILNDIEDDPKSYEFREPVPWRELGLSDYPEIIKKPMDLKTVRSKLVKGKYNNYEEFFKDVYLIWDNCKTYNIQGSDIYKLAEDCEKISRRAINKAKEAIGLIKGKAKKKTTEEAKGGDAEMEDEEVDNEKKSSE